MVLVSGITTVTECLSQSQTQVSAENISLFKYDIASLKPNKSDSTSGIRPTPDGLIATNVSIRTLIQVAYDVRYEQISGVPAWVDSESFDVNAKMEAPVADALQKLSRPDRILARMHMLQALLADRFNLEVHHDTKELPVYWLVIAKNGLKLKEATPGDTYPNGLKSADGTSGAGLMRSTGGRGGQTTTGQGVPIADLVRVLTGFVDRPVLDKTGLTGNYDFILNWSGNGAALQTAPAADSPDTSGPSLFAALQEELGLKLESAKGSVETIVIDHVERPSGN